MHHSERKAGKGCREEGPQEDAVSKGLIQNPILEGLTLLLQHLDIQNAAFEDC